MSELYLLILKYRRVGIDRLSEETALPVEVIRRRLESIGEYVRVSNDIVELVNPLGLADKLIRSGVSYKRVSRYLDWRDFEELSSRILSAHRYSIYRNFRLTKPVMLEIDVIGIDPGSGRGLFIDCKHWTHGIYRKALIEYAEKQYMRVLKLIKYLSWAKSKWHMFNQLRSAIPLIVTLTTPSLRMHSGVLIVSIQELNQVLIDLDYVLDFFGVRPIVV